MEVLLFDPQCDLYYFKVDKIEWCFLLFQAKLLKMCLTVKSSRSWESKTIAGSQASMISADRKTVQTVAYFLLQGPCSIFSDALRCLFFHSPVVKWTSCPSHCNSQQSPHQSSKNRECNFSWTVSQKTFCKTKFWILIVFFLWDYHLIRLFPTFNSSILQMFSSLSRSPAICWTDFWWLTASSPQCSTSDWRLVKMLEIQLTRGWKAVMCSNLGFNQIFSLV